MVKLLTTVSTALPMVRVPLPAAGCEQSIPGEIGGDGPGKSSKRLASNTYVESSLFRTALVTADPTATPFRCERNSFAADAGRIHVLCECRGKGRSTAERRGHGGNGESGWPSYG